MNLVGEAYGYSNITSTTTVYPSNCIMLGIFVSQASGSPSITVSDGATTVVAAFAPTAASFYPIPAQLNTSLRVTISGTVNCTVFWST